MGNGVSMDWFTCVLFSFFFSFFYVSSGGESGWDDGIGSTGVMWW
jgi:hypothetical protein